MQTSTASQATTMSHLNLHFTDASGSGSQDSQSRNTNDHSTASFRDHIPHLNRLNVLREIPIPAATNPNDLPRLRQTTGPRPGYLPAFRNNNDGVNSRPRLRLRQVVRPSSGYLSPINTTNTDTDDQSHFAPPEGYLPPLRQVVEIRDDDVPEIYEEERQRYIRFRPASMLSAPHQRGFPVSHERFHARRDAVAGAGMGIGYGQGSPGPRVVITGAGDEEDDGSDDSEASGDGWRMHSVSFTPRAPPSPPIRQGLSRAPSPDEDEQPREMGASGEPSETRLERAQARFAEAQAAHARARARFTDEPAPANPTTTDGMGRGRSTSGSRARFTVVASRSETVDLDHIGGEQATPGAAQEPARRSNIRTPTRPTRRPAHGHNPNFRENHLLPSTPAAAAAGSEDEPMQEPFISDHLPRLPGHRHHPLRARGPRPPILTPTEAAGAEARATRAEVQSATPDSDELTYADLQRALGPERWEDGLFLFDSSGNLHARPQQPEHQAAVRPPPRPAARLRRPTLRPEPLSSTVQRGEDDELPRPQRRPAIPDLSRFPPELRPRLWHNMADHLQARSTAETPDGQAEDQRQQHRHHHRGHGYSHHGHNHFHHPAHFEAQNRDIPVDIYHGIPLNWHRASQSAVDTMVTKPLTAQDLSEDGTATCAICSDDVEVGHEITLMPSCIHWFHGKCIKKWLSEYHSTCPLCREDLVKKDDEATRDNFRSFQGFLADVSDAVVASEGRAQTREELDAAYMERRRRRNEARAPRGGRSLEIENLVDAWVEEM